MRKTLLLSTALGAGLLLGAPAFAQSGAQSGMSPSVAPLPAQQHAASSAESMSMQREVMSLLRQSEQAVSAGNWARANEFLERAQTSTLNRQATGGGPVSPGHMSGMHSFEEAKQAIMSRNRNEARHALQTAMSEAGRSDSMNTGAGTGPMPMQSGGRGDMGSGSMGYGTMRDQGMGDRSMSRADIILAQGGGGGQGEGSGGLAGSTPGSPGAGTGSGSSPNPAVTAPPTSGSNPPVGSALQPSTRSGTETGAPAPGSTSVTPTPGVGTPRATSPGAGGPTGGQSR